MENKRALGKMLSRLRESSGCNDRQKPSSNGCNSAKANGSKKDDAKTNVSHPKAVGDLLKLMQSEKEKFYEEPPERKSDLKIFTPSYERPSMHQEEEYYDEEAEWEEDAKEDDDEFYCDLCKISCTSQVVMDTHLIGKKHKKNVNKLKQNTLAFNKDQPNPVLAPRPRKVADIQVRFEELTENKPVVGLEYITEYQKLNGSPHRYFCELCLFRADAAGILDHVVTRNHRLRYMRSHFFDIYYKITNFPSFQHVMRTSEADKLLAQHSSFVVRTILKGSLRFCKVRPYYGEQSITIDRHSIQPGKIHPSEYKDLPRAEALLIEGEAKERRELEEEQKREKERAEREKRAEVERVKRENVILSQRLSGNNLQSDVINLNPSDALADLKAKKLDQQERRVLNALRQLQESSGGKQMTLEETNAQDKLKRLLIGIRAEKKRNLLSHIGKISSDVEAELGLSTSGEMQEMSGRPQPRNTMNDQLSAGNSPSDLVKARQLVEAKIFQALSGGSLAPLAEAFKKNPQLQAGLKQWERVQGNSHPGPSSEDHHHHRRSDNPPSGHHHRSPEHQPNNRPGPSFKDHHHSERDHTSSMHHRRSPNPPPNNKREPGSSHFDDYNLKRNSDPHRTNERQHELRNLGDRRSDDVPKLHHRSMFAGPSKHHSNLQKHKPKLAHLHDEYTNEPFLDAEHERPKKIETVLHSGHRPLNKFAGPLKTRPNLQNLHTDVGNTHDLDDNTFSAVDHGRLQKIPLLGARPGARFDNRKKMNPNLQKQHPRSGFLNEYDDVNFSSGDHAPPRKRSAPLLGLRPGVSSRHLEAETFSQNPNNRANRNQLDDPSRFDHLFDSPSDYNETRSAGLLGSRPQFSHGPVKRSKHGTYKRPAPHY